MKTYKDIDHAEGSSIADTALGTCKSDGELADYFELNEEDLVEVLLDHGIERCEQCGWWVESFELVDDDLNNTGKCQDCQNE